MNETINTILARRSVRKYSDEQIKENELDLIIKAGLFAPSGCNAQPWHFTVVQNKELIKNLNIDAKKELLKAENETFRTLAANEDFDIFYNAPTIIVISGEKNAPVPQTDCAAATENMLLAAESLNIGTCWIGLVGYLFRSNNAEKYIKLLKIPQGYEPYYAITLGYKVEETQQAPPRKENTVNYIR